MSPDDIEAHNLTCTYDEIIWCKCDKPVHFPNQTSCYRCGGMRQGIWISTDHFRDATKMNADEVKK